MTIQDLLARIVARLGDAEVPYMLTGSYASSLHSVPRATRDLDVVVFPSRDQLIRLLHSLPSTEYHVDVEDALEALRRRSQFNVIDYASGWKVDFIIPPFDDFHIEEFERRITINAEWATATQFESVINTDTESDGVAFVISGFHEF